MEEYMSKPLTRAIIFVIVFILLIGIFIITAKIACNLSGSESMWCVG